jgi:hypothetical protein
MASQAKLGRSCSRVSCRSAATMTLTYIYAESTAVLGPLATFSEPHSYDLCVAHGQRLTVPQGWNVIRQELIHKMNQLFLIRMRNPILVDVVTCAPCPLIINDEH